MKLETLAEGELLADGTEQNVAVCDTLAIVSGYVSMSKMEPADEIKVKQFIMVNSVEELYHQETYSGVQAEPLIHFQSRALKDQTRITLQQTAGSYKTFDYEFVREV